MKSYYIYIFLVNTCQLRLQLLWGTNGNRVLDKDKRYPKRKTKSKTMIDDWYLDICGQTTTLYSQLHEEFVSCSLVVEFSDISSDVIILFILSWNSFFCSWIKAWFPVEDLLSLFILILQLASKVSKSCAPISLMVESIFAVDNLPPDAIFCLENNRQ